MATTTYSQADRRQELAQTTGMFAIGNDLRVTRLGFGAMRASAKRRLQPNEICLGFFVCLCCFAPMVAYSQTISASANARPTQFNDYVSQSYTGDISGLQNLVAVTSDPNRYGEAHASIIGLSASSTATDSGIGYPDANASLQGYQVAFANTPALSAAIAANGGQPLQMYASFPAKFTLLNTPNPSNNGFHQTSTEALARIVLSAPTFATIQGELIASNGPYDAYSISTSGFLQANMINAGFFDVHVPFIVDTSNLTTSFSVDVDSNSLSLDLETYSSAQLLLPSHSDIYLASGQPPSSLGLDYQVSSVPEPGTFWTHAGGGSWATSANWNPSSVPNGDGTNVYLQLATSSSSLLNVTLDGQQTVGALYLANTANAASGYNITSGTGGTQLLVLSNTGNIAQVIVTSGSQAISAPVSLASNLVISLSSDSSLAISGNISGPGKSLTLTYGGSLLLSGSNSYSGGTAIGSGTLTLGGAGNLGGGNYAAAIVDNSCLVVATAADQVLSGAISGSGSLLIQGNGQLTLSGTSSSLGGALSQSGSGGLTVSGGLAAGSYTQTGSGSLAISGSLTSAASVTIGTTSGDNLSVNMSNGALTSSTTGAGSMVFSNVPVRPP